MINPRQTWTPLTIEKRINAALALSNPSQTSEELHLLIAEIQDCWLIHYHNKPTPPQRTFFDEAVTLAQHVCNQQHIPVLENDDVISMALQVARNIAPRPSCFIIMEWQDGKARTPIAVRFSRHEAETMLNSFRDIVELPIKT